MYFIVTKKTHILAFVLSCILIIFQFNTINEINMSILTSVGSYRMLKYYIILILILLINSLIHELIHGLAYVSFGGKFIIGFKGTYFYTKEITGVRLKVKDFAIVLLAPLTIISTLSLFIPMVGGLIFFVNLLGSTGDLIMTWRLMKLSKDALIVDIDEGFYVENK